MGCRCLRYGPFREGFASPGAACSRAAEAIGGALATNSPALRSFLRPALVIEREGKGLVVVAPVWMINPSVKSLVPGEGVPHSQVYLGGRPLEAKAQRLAHTVEEATRLVLRWWQLALELDRQPLRPPDLAPLKAMAKVRAESRSKAALGRVKRLCAGQGNDKTTPRRRKHRIEHQASGDSLETPG